MLEKVAWPILRGQLRGLLRITQFEFFPRSGIIFNKNNEETNKEETNNEEANNEAN